MIESPPVQTTYLCNICNNFMKSEQVVTLNCGHVICKSHAIDYIENHYGETITCPIMECGRGVIREKQILSICGQQRYNALKKGVQKCSICSSPYIAERSVIFFCGHISCKSHFKDKIATTYPNNVSCNINNCPHILTSREIIEIIGKQVLDSMEEVATRKFLES